LISFVDDMDFELTLSNGSLYSECVIYDDKGEYVVMMIFLGQQ